jgi:hypothetical protein
MNINEYLTRQIGVARRYLDGALQNLTDEQLNWTPPGLANGIGATLLHLLGGEDMIFQAVLRDQPTIWETGGWADRVGVAQCPMHTDTWKPVMACQLSLASIIAYKKAVQAATDAYLASLTPEMLDRKVTFVGAERPVGEVLVMCITHISHHAGEVSALKGVQGCQGLPF